MLCETEGNMNVILLPAALVLAILLVFVTLPPGLFIPLGAMLSVLLAIASVVEIVRVSRDRPTKGPAAAPISTAPRPEPPAVAAPAPSAEADVVQFLGRLQEKGRLVDFAMEEIAGYSDEQVGSVARVVHQGCREVLQSSFEIRPVHGGAEGEEVALAQDYDARSYRVVGKVPERPPFRGTVRHRGWKTSRVSLPTVTAEGAAREIIAPAEVEIE
jgi:hypothetical protein